MAEEKKSKLYALRPLIKRWPAVTKPEGHVNFRTKILWTLTCLIIYFVLTNVMIFGLSPGSMDMFAQYRFIMAGASGSIVHLGIGPIVTASIILQLFVGADIINLDLQDPEDKSIYQGTQKILVIVMIVVEAIPQIFGYLQPSEGLINLVGGAPSADLIIVTQIIIGSLFVFLMDELISKWGIGSGISLFIAAGVSQQVFTGIFNWLPVQGTGTALSLSNPPGGVIPGTYYLTTHMSLPEIVKGGYQVIFLGNPSRGVNYINAILPLLSFLFIFFIIVYVQSSRLELPLSHARVRGARGRYPIRLIYTSNIPAILMSALLANINMFSMLLYRAGDKIPFLGGQWWIGKYPAGASRATAGGAWYLSRVNNGIHGWLIPIFQGGYGGHEPWQFALKVITYLGAMVFGAILFAKFWVETTNMGPDAVARQIRSSGMQIPGFRKDPRVLKRVLKRYIPVVTVISGATIGALAGSADTIGTVGKTSGTGVLLTVGIIIRLYEEIGKEQAMEMHPVLRGFFGKE